MLCDAKCFADALTKRGADVFDVGVLLANVVVGAAGIRAIIRNRLIACTIGARGGQRRERRALHQAVDRHGGVAERVGCGCGGADVDHHRYEPRCWCDGGLLGYWCDGGCVDVRRCHDAAGERHGDARRERDVVRELAQNENVLNEPVSRVMTSDVIIARPGDDAKAVSKTMTVRRLSQMDDDS